MADKESPDYWHERIQQEGAYAIERQLPKMEGKKREAAKQALSEHGKNQTQSADERREDREERAVAAAERADKKASLALVIAVISAVASVIALFSNKG